MVIDVKLRLLYYFYLNGKFYTADIEAFGVYLKEISRTGNFNQEMAGEILKGLLSD